MKIIYTKGILYVRTDHLDEKKTLRLKKIIDRYDIKKVVIKEKGKTIYNFKSFISKMLLND